MKRISSKPRVRPQRASRIPESAITVKIGTTHVDPVTVNPYAAIANLARDEARDRQVAYGQTFTGSDAAEKVLADLEKFCRADESCFNPDDRLTAILLGRQEVILRIRDFLNLTIDEICQKYGVPSAIQEPDLSRRR